MYAQHPVMPLSIILQLTFARLCMLQLWRTHIKRPMILVGPSLGAAVAIDFAVNFPEAVCLSTLFNKVPSQIFFFWYVHRILIFTIIEKWILFLSNAYWDTLQVDRLILIDASVYVEGTGLLRKLPKILAYAMVIVSHSFYWIFLQVTAIF